MTLEIESELKQLFAAADVDLPAADFTARVLSQLQTVHRRERSIGLAALVTALVCLSLWFPSLESALGTAAGYARIGREIGTESLLALAQSPLVYVYGAALAGYLLLKLVGRLQIRWM